MKKLYVFDLDGCLMDTPLPTNKQTWEEYYNMKYPHVGWWGRKESLDTNVFDIKPFPNILNELNKASNEMDSHVIILTSRREKLRPQIENILRINNITVDDTILKRGNEGKGDVILKIVNYNPELEEIVVFDDFMNGNSEKILEYTKIINDLPEKINYVLNYVDNNTFKPLNVVNEGRMDWRSIDLIINDVVEKII